MVIIFIYIIFLKGCIQSYGFVSKFHLPTTNGKLRRFEKPETYDFNEFEKDDRMVREKILMFLIYLNLGNGIESS